MKWPTAKEIDCLLDNVAKRRAILETAVESVVKGYTSALFVWGPAGLGKTHVLTALLDGIGGLGWKHHTAYSTAKGLFLSIAESPEAVHLFEDCETLLKTRTTADILRGACGAPDGKPRIVTYETANEKYRVVFRGGIIIATNTNLSRVNGPMQGVCSRFRPIKWDLSMPERIASIARLAEGGYHKGKVAMSAKECIEVAQFLIDAVESGQCETDVDLRLFCEHCLPTFAHVKAMGSGNWRDVVLAKLQGVASTTDEREYERMNRLQSLASLIAAGPGNTAEKLQTWKARTGLGRAIYFRHLKASRAK